MDVLDGFFILPDGRSMITLFVKMVSGTFDVGGDLDKLFEVFLKNEKVNLPDFIAAPEKYPQVGNLGYLHRYLNYSTSTTYGYLSFSSVLRNTERTMKISRNQQYPVHT